MFQPRPFAAWLLLLTASTLWSDPIDADTALAPQRPPRGEVDVARSAAGMVACETPLAAAIGRDVLAAGGNAVDAAVAVGFALEVTWPEAGNLGGGGFMLVAPPRGDVQCVDYREVAPRRVTETSLQNETSKHGVRFVGVPGTVAGFDLAHRKYGKLPWSQLLEPSIALAADGFLVDRELASSLNACLSSPRVQDDELFAEFRRVYGGPHEGVWRAGDRLTQPDLAKTLRLIAASGTAGFYEGSIAEAIASEIETRGGWIDQQDLRDYRAVLREPVRGQFAGHEIYGMAPPSSGGTIVQMQLSMIEQLGVDRGVAEDGTWTADQVHLIVETMRRAFRDRGEFLGDPDFTPPPADLLDADRIKRLAQTIDPDAATDSLAIAGNLTITPAATDSEQTTHYSIVDAEGMGVSNTYTLEQAFGSGVVVPGTGVLLNNEMGDFGWKPGVVDVWGMIGTPPNRVGPRKRMLSSMSPTIVRRDGELRLIVGSPGGRTIINTVTEVLVRRLWMGQTLAQAVDAPRFHHQWLPDEIRFESADRERLGDVAADLIARGHRVDFSGERRQGAAHCIERVAGTGELIGVADWRRGGAARGVRPAGQAAVAVGATAADVDGIQRRASDQIRDLAPRMNDAAMDIWRYAEPGYQETRSSKRLIDLLSEHDFAIQSPIAGMPTAFVASRGSGEPVIAFLAEYDALPGLSQQASPVQSPRPEAKYGHGCGHHLFGVASAAAAIAVADRIDAGEIAGTVRVYGCPAEEGGSAKSFMARDGLFDDCDAAIHWHPSSENVSGNRGAIAKIGVKFRFRGRSAHAASSPERGRSALDAVELTNHAAQMLREHVPDATRIHHVITAGGSAPNVVPDFAEVYYYIRHPDSQVLAGLYDRLVLCARAGALATETQLEIDHQGGTVEMLNNDVLDQIATRNLRRENDLRIEEDEMPFIARLRQSLIDPPPLESIERVQRGEGSVGRGSTDVSDVSWVTPTTGFAVATWIPGTPGHSWQAVACGTQPLAMRGMNLAARAIAGTAIELMADPEKLAAAAAEHRGRLGQRSYAPLIGPTQPPPLDYRQAAGRD